MDDQYIGVQSRAEGLRVLNKVGDSLRRLHLTANAGKSKIPSLSEAKKHVHFASNQSLDDLDKSPYSSRKQRRELELELRKAWKRAVDLEGIGEWQKILGRFYRYAARARSVLFVDRAAGDVVDFPGLTDRIADYVRYVTSPSRCLNFVMSLLENDEQVYPDINYRLIESLLKIEPQTQVAKRLQRFEVVPGRFKARITISKDSITGAKYIDMRSYLAARILGLSTNRAIANWLRAKKAELLAEDISAFERELLRKLWPAI